MLNASWRLALTLGLAGMLSASMSAWAQAPVQAARHAPVQASQSVGKASLDIMIVHANKSGKVDPRLKGVERNLKFTGLSGFKLVSEESVKLGKGQEATIPGGGGTRLKVTLVDHDGQQARARFQLMRGSESRFDTTTKAPKGKAFIIRGPQVDGGTMVYVITYK